MRRREWKACFGGQRWEKIKKKWGREWAGVVFFVEAVGGGGGGGEGKGDVVGLFLSWRRVCV